LGALDSLGPRAVSDPALKQGTKKSFGASIFKFWGPITVSGDLGSLGPRAETLKQGTKRKRLGSIFWGLEFSGGPIQDSLGARSGALFGPRAETENKISEKK
jgi:hypothetical protein